MNCIHRVTSFPRTRKQAWCAFAIEAVLLLACIGGVLWKAHTDQPSASQIHQMTPYQTILLNEMLRRWEREGRDQ